MLMKYRKLLWGAVVLIAVTSSTLAIVSVRMRRTPRVEEQSRIAAERRADKPGLTLGTAKSTQRRTSEELRDVGAQNDAVSPAEGQSDKKQVEVEVVTVRPNGFEPREITRRHGAFMLAIVNHTGATELVLHLDRVQGSRLHDVPLSKGRIRWNKTFDLAVGDYVLSEQNHPDWICSIKLTAR